ncbi:hypothetical protein BH23BAC3_BH23BAC3_09090 [soil metagenome]
MLLRVLFFALLLFLLYRYLSRKLGSGSASRRGRENARFDRGAENTTNGQRKKNLDQIEDAEFEDITDKEKKENL